jgi:hypothetical protein
MSLQSHLSELAAKHKALETKIEKELGRLSADALEIVEMKRKKLKLKDEIVKIEAQLSGHAH